MKTGLINNKCFKDNKMRIDPSFHLSEGQLVNQLIVQSPYGISSIGSASMNIFYGNRAKRIYVTKKEKGIPFLSSSDILQADIENVKLVSKKYTPGIDEMKLVEGWTLVSRSGTIGNCAYVDKRYTEKLSSEHVIRVCPNTKFKKGLLFAYLASKYGHSLLTQGSFGAVIQHIEPDFVGNLPIPSFPTSFQEEVNNLIQQAALLRKQAADVLKEAVSIFEDEIGISSTDYAAYRKELISIKSIAGKFRRIDSQYQIGHKSIGIEKQNLNTIKISSIAKAIFTGNRGKRYYVDNDGIFFLSSSDIMLANPKRFCKKISRKTPNLNDLLVPKGTILISRSGTVGNTIIVGDDLKGSAVSEHAMRLIVDENKITPEYVFAYFCTKQGKDSLAILPYGSVIVTLGEEFLGDVDLPLLSDEKQKNITELVQTYTQNNDLAVANENKAITMVEEEIEKWQSPTA